MRVLFDTNVLIAALVDSHTLHLPALKWLIRADRGEFELVVSTHSMLEFYSSVTRVSAYGISTDSANKLIRNEIFAKAEMITLSTLDYLEVLDLISSKKLAGGIVYDGLIIQAAKLAKVDHILTFNTKHFRRVWPEGAAIIIEP